MAETLTMMAVHAHPADEASSTGGVLAAYSAQGIRTVVVTRTNGEFGDARGGVKPGQNGHEEQAVAPQRLAELRESCAILGVTNLELLGYHDSGMPEWDYKDRPDAFCNIPEADVAARISQLIDRYRPQVLITYDDQAAYQHPDHVHASRSAQKAFAASGSVAKLYLTAMRGSDWRKIWEALRELGMEMPDRVAGPVPDGRARRPGGGRLLRARERGLAGPHGPGRAGGGAAVAADPGAAPAGDGRGRPAQRLAHRSGRQARRHLRLRSHGHVRGPGQRHPGRAAGAGHPPARPRRGHRDRPAVRGPRSGAAAVGARRPGGFGPGREQPIRHAADRGGRRRLRGRDDYRGRTARGAAPDGPGQRGRPRTLLRGCPGGPAPHARGRGVDELPARPARA